MRAWYMPNMSLGLLYNCTLGDIRPDYPVALVANHNRDGADFMEVIPTENQVPAQREQVSIYAMASDAMRACPGFQSLKQSMLVIGS